MGTIVGAFGTAHILMSPVGVEEEAERVFAGMVEVGKRVQASKPDVLVVITGDHMFNIGRDFEIPLAVGTADIWHPFGDLNTGTAPFPGHKAFAEGFVAFAAHEDFDITKANSLKPDHGVTLPLRFACPDKNVPVVPVLININMEPLPEPRRYYRLGEVLKDYVEQHRPEGERVAVLATGGLSHWLFVPRMGEVAETWDRNFLTGMAQGRAKELSQMKAADVVEAAGNGGIEVVAWIMAGATLPGVKGDEVYYEPVAQWGTGFGGLAIAA